MLKLKQPVILNSAGQPIVLTEAEQYHADWTQRQLNDRHQNSLGYEINITTLTAIAKRISEMKLYKVPFADYVPVVVGEGTWDSNITTYRSYMIGDAFETGVINLAGQDDRLAVTDAAVDAVNVPIFNWAKTNEYSIFALQQAARSGNWSLIEQKEKSRLTNWQLGLQRIAFLGMRNATTAGCLGLLNQPGITTNTALITKAISSMTATELKTFCRQIISVYRTNVSFTAMPNRFVVPETDYNGMATQSSPDFPIKSVKQVLEETFIIITEDPSFRILPSAYADVGQSGFSYQIYALYNYDVESFNMNIPLAYTNTLANSINNFQFSNVGYGQFTGVQSLRPLEMMYFVYTP